MFWILNIILTIISLFLAFSSLAPLAHAFLWLLVRSVWCEWLSSPCYFLDRHLLSVCLLLSLFDWASDLFLPETIEFIRHLKAFYFLFWWFIFVFLLLPSCKWISILNPAWLSWKQCRSECCFKEGSILLRLFMCFLLRIDAGGLECHLCQRGDIWFMVSWEEVLGWC